MKNISYTYIMGYSDGQVQSSSDSGKAQKGDPGLPGIGFNLTDDGNFDLDGKRLTDVADPVDNRDAVTKGYLTLKILDRILLSIVKQKKLMLTQKIPHKTSLLIVKLIRIKSFY